MDDPMPITRGLALPLAEIAVRASRSSGPGGQHANVTASRIEAIFEIDRSPTLAPWQRERLRARFGPRVTAVAQDHRSQTHNRELALERLQARLIAGLAIPKSRTATRPTKASRRRHAAAKQRQAQRKRERRRPSISDE